MRLRYSLLPFIWVVLFFQSMVVKSQSLSPSLIYSAGQKSTNAQFGTLDYAIGEAVISPTTTNIGQNLILTQGYYQVYVISVTTDVEDVGISDSNIEIFPNPSSHYFTLKSDLPVRYTLYNLQGRLIKFTDTEDTKHEIHVLNLNEGMYILETTDYKKQIKKSFKIIITKS